MNTTKLGSVFRSGLFNGNVAVVTGGGTGIGAAIARELAELGCRVVIASRKFEVLEQYSKKVNKEIGKELVHPIKCNIRQENDVKGLMEGTVTKFGKLNYLVNNGGGQFISKLSDMNTKGWNAVIDLNLNGTYYCLREAYHAWMGKNGGSIVNIVVNNWNGFPMMSHTGAARAGIQNLTKSLALEWAEKGIRINSIAPGVIYSDTAAANYKNHPDLFTKVKGIIPLKRTGTVEEISGLTCFLLSPAASFMTGDVLKVDGGQSLFGHTGFSIGKHSNSEPYQWQDDL